jgi:hypothetical protein
VTARTGTLVVRAWVEDAPGQEQLRARVLAISGPGAHTSELGVAAGLDDILELIADGLTSVLGRDGEDLNLS